MSAWALALFGVYLGTAFGLRTVIQVRRTGSTGFKGIGGRPGSTEWLAGVLFAAALVAGFLAPVLDAVGAVEPLAAVDGPGAHAAGFALFATGLVITLLAQLAMGDSWRIGVDSDERTTLVTAGPFALVRNPIFMGMLPASLGLALLVPNAVALAAFVALVGALELQTRVVEEPYLLRVHGDVYAGYAARVGRFVPGVGRLGNVRP